MVYKSIRREAENLEKRAKILAEQTYRKERYSHMPYTELDSWRKKTFTRYNQAADMFVNAGKKEKAVEMYNGAIRFAPSEQVKEKVKERVRRLTYGDERRLEGRVYATASIISLIVILFFISFNLTGNTIGNLNSDNLTLIGTGFFLFSLIFLFLYAQEKKKEH